MINNVFIIIDKSSHENANNSEIFHDLLGDPALKLLAKKGFVGSDVPAGMTTVSDEEAPVSTLDRRSPPKEDGELRSPKSNGGPSKDIIEPPGELV